MYTHITYAHLFIYGQQRAQQPDRLRIYRLAKRWFLNKTFCRKSILAIGMVAIYKVEGIKLLSLNLFDLVFFLLFLWKYVARLPIR